MAEETDADLTDELPSELDPGAVGPGYRIPDNNRRRISGALHIAVGLAAVAVRVIAGDDSVLTNNGLFVAGGVLCAIGVFQLIAGRRLRVDETAALVAATRAVGFPVGHASAQLAWRGLLSRPTWRVLLYSADEPPTRRGFVLVCGIDGTVVEQLVEDNPEDWSDLKR